MTVADSMGRDRFEAAVVTAVDVVAERVKAFELRLVTARSAPFSPGAHIDVRLPDGAVRSYSLLSAGPTAYRIAVKREAQGRGGSAFMHDEVRVGMPLAVSAPKNHFRLCEDAASSVFIVGGIGITPVLGMIRRLERLGRPWVLHYAARCRAQAAFADELAPYARRVHFYFGDEADSRLPLGELLAQAAPGAHLYCCGPATMLDEFERLSARWERERIHLERFAPKPRRRATQGFTVEFARSGKSAYVPEGKSILDVALDHGVEVNHACLEGVCGNCETTIIEGEPVHRDEVLSAAERAANRSMMICCSGCRGNKLVLDL